MPSDTLTQDCHPRPPGGPAPATGILLDRGSLLLLLRPGGAPPPAVARLEIGEGALATWRALAWDGDGGAAALGLLRGQDLPLARLQDAPLRGAEPGEAWRLPEIGRLELEPEALVEHVRMTGGNGRAVFDFLRLELLSEAGEPVPVRVREFLQGFLFGVSRRDGFVEILGAPEGDGLFFQGWSQSLAAGQRDVGIAAAGFVVTGCILAAFDRPDLLPPARGFVGFAKDAREIEPEGVRAVFFQHGLELLRLDIVRSDRILLSPADAVAHVRDMLARLHGDLPVVRGFKRICRPRFPGVETISTVAAPVRLAADLAVAAPGAGILVTGWRLDPEQRTRLVLLKSTRSFYARLTDQWACLPRPDVSEAFAADPLFRDLLRPDDRYHGFIAFAPRERPPEPDERFYLELVLDDESCAFLPIEVEQGSGLRHLPRLLGSIGPEHPDLERVVAQQLAPFAAAVTLSRRPAAAFGEPLPLGRANARPEVSVVMPLGGSLQQAEVAMACLAGPRVEPEDPEIAPVELVLVAARADAETIASRVRRSAAFYGLSGQLVVAHGRPDFGEALALGAAAASGELLLALAPSVLPRGKAWLGRLVEALRRAPAPGLVCPTLLYEDHSIRYAGRSPQRIDASAALSRLAGYSDEWLRGAATTSVAHGPAACFLIRRDLFLETGGLSGPFVGPELGHLDLALRLRARGCQCFWVPDVELYAVDDAQPQVDEAWRGVARLVDQRIFDHRWRDAIAAAPLHPQRGSP